MPNIIHITRADDLSISNNQLVMIDEDNNDEKNKISLNDISAIVIENCHCKISAILQLRLVENNIPIIICNEKHQPEIHSLGLFNHFQVTLRINEQIEWSKKKKENLMGERGKVLFSSFSFFCRFSFLQLLSTVFTVMGKR